jgi:hypothetical protein
MVIEDETFEDPTGKRSKIDYSMTGAQYLTQDSVAPSAGAWIETSLTAPLQARLG